MLTVKQPAQYGYKSVHDLPTPPSTSRPSPPLIFQEAAQKAFSAAPRSNSPSSQPMSAPHRGLPPPAAMTLAPQPHPVPGHPPPPPAPGPPLGQHPPPPPPPPPLPQQQQQQHQQHAPMPGSMLGQLPPPPQWQQGAEEAMRAWLMAKAEEEKRRAEELRLEQRRTEHEILRTSLQGGIPPPMVPVVFAGMGGGNLPHEALEAARQFMYSQAQPPAPQLLPAGPSSPGHRRDSQSQAYGLYPGSGGMPSTPGSAQGPHGGQATTYPGSPTRSRGYTVPGPGGRPLGGASNLPSLNTNVPQGSAAPGPSSHPGMAVGQAQLDSQPSQTYPFHYWQPPATQAGMGGANQPGTPSAVGQSPRKRKNTEPPPNPRHRSPPTFSLAAGPTLANPPPGRGRGHSRQRSDVSSYRPPGARGQPETPYGGMSPAHASAPGSAREADEGPGPGAGPARQQTQASRSGAHSVSSLLSEEPQYQQQQRGEGEQRDSPPRHPQQQQQQVVHASEENSRGGAAGSAATREGDND